MTERLYTSSEVREILDISQRRMTHFAEKGLIIPVEDAKGAGSKRLYNYLNLLEFALCQMLFDMELGIHLVKRIVSDLRKDKKIKLWASKDAGKIVSRTHTITDSDGDDLVGSDVIEDALSGNQKKNSGTLYYIYGNYKTEKGGYKEIFLILSPENLPNFRNVLEDCDVEDFMGMIVVNVERIKNLVDEGIKKIK